MFQWYLQEKKNNFEMYMKGIQGSKVWGKSSVQTRNERKFLISSLKLFAHKYINHTCLGVYL